MKLYKRISVLLTSTLLVAFNSNFPVTTYGAEVNSSNTNQQVFLKVNSQWDNSFIGELLITNTSNTSLSNWRLQFDCPHQITSIWNAKLFQDATTYTLECEDYNSIIYPNQTISVGFIANYNTNIIIPEDYILSSNGKIIESSIHPTTNITTPCMLQLDLPYEQNFTTSKDELWFSFTPSTSGSYEFISHGDTNLFTSLYDDTKQNIICTNENTSNTKSLGSTLLANKDYYIKISPLNFNRNKSNFSLTVHQIEIPNDPLFINQWSLLNTSTGIDINILPVWSHLNTHNLPISMADTGVYSTHEDLSNNINLDLSYNFTHHINNVFPENELYGDAYTATYGHGTHVAGIIGAEINNNTGIAGIVPSADLVSLKALGRRLQGTTTYTKSIAAFVEAVAYAQENDIHLMNCSFGGSSPSAAEKDAMLQANDILFVIAGGNSSNDLEESPEYPACYYHSNSLVVANINSDGNLESSSNYGGPTDIAAPGTNIISTMPYDEYDYMSGTSMAAPYVTAVCSLVWAQNHSLTPEEVKSYVTNSSNVTPLDSLTNTTLSGGMLNAYKAIVSPSLIDEPRDIQVFRNPFSGSTKDKITYYKGIALNSSKTDEIIVKFNDSSLINDWIDKINDFYEFKEISINNYLESIDAYVLKFASIDEADIAIDYLNTLKNVVYAEPNYIRE